MARVRPGLVRDFAPAPERIAPDLWSLERRLRMPGGPRLSTRSTIIRLPSSGLLVVSPPAVECGGLEALDALGAVEDIVVPNSFHYLNAAEFAARYPKATLRWPPALHRRVAGLPKGEELSASPPPSWGGAIELAVLGPVDVVSEVAFFHRPSATLILTDVAFNMTRFARRRDRLAWRVNGVPTSFGPARTSRMMLLRDRPAAKAFLERVIAWPFRRILVAHGDPLEHDAAAVFRRAFATYLRGPAASA